MNAESAQPTNPKNTLPRPANYAPPTIFSSVNIPEGVQPDRLVKLLSIFHPAGSWLFIGLHLIVVALLMYACSIMSPFAQDHAGERFSSWRAFNASFVAGEPAWALTLGLLSGCLLGIRMGKVLRAHALPQSCLAFIRSGRFSPVNQRKNLLLFLPILWSYWAVSAALGLSLTLLASTNFLIAIVLSHRDSTKLYDAMLGVLKQEFGPAADEWVQRASVRAVRNAWTIFVLFALLFSSLIVVSTALR